MSPDADDASIPPIPPHELDMAVEEALGRPAPGTAAERIAALRERVTYLEGKIAECLVRIADSDVADALALQEVRHSYEAALRQARTLLLEYATQDRGRN
jgi:hypothetical protein